MVRPHRHVALLCGLRLRRTRRLPELRQWYVLDGLCFNGGEGGCTCEIKDCGDEDETPESAAAAP